MKKSSLHGLILLTMVLLQANAQGAQAPELKSYPQSDMIWLGSYAGLVEVNPRIELESVRYGDLHWVVEDGAEVKAGESAAYCAYAKVLHSNAQLKKAEDELKLSLRTTKWEHLKETEGLEQEASAIEDEIAKFSFSDHEKKLAGQKLSARVDQHRKKLEAKLDIARDQISPEMRDEQLRLKLEQLELEIRGKQIENRDLINTLSIRAPHGGIIHQHKAGEVQVGDVIGNVERRGRAVLMLPMIDAEILREKPKSLAVTTTGSKGRTLKGSFSEIYQKVGIVSGPKTYLFELLPDGDFELSDDTTGERMVSIYRKLERRAYIVPKTKFLFENTEEVQKLGWHKFIKSKWPDAEIVYIGPNAIAIAQTP